MTFHALLPMVAYVLTTVWAASLWQGGLLVLLGAVVQKLMPNASATLRHSLLIALFMLAVALPWLPIRHASGAAHATHALHLSFWVAVGITACWALAAICRAISLMIAWQHLRSVRRNAVPFTLDLEKMDIGINRRPIVCTSPDVDSPLIVGFFHPVLLLPDWLAPTLGAEELRQIALHECEHLRRHDDWTNLFVQIGLMLFPLNPALLWLNRHIGVQRELACDAAVVAATSRPVDYAASLAKIADQHLRRNTLRLALAAWERQSELSHRIHALLKQQRCWSAAQRTLAASAAATILAAFVVGLANAPQLICMQTPSKLIVASTSGHSTSQLTPIITPSLSGQMGAEPLKLLPAAYVAHPSARLQPVVTRKALATRRRRQPQFVYTSKILETVDVPSVRIVSVSATAVSLARGENLQPEAPPRAVPALYSPTYLAVAVPDGWLLIKL